MMSGIVVGIGQALFELCTLNAAKKGKSIGPHVIKMCDADGCWRWKGYDRTSHERESYLGPSAINQKQKSKFFELFVITHILDFIHLPHAQDHN